MTEDSGAADDGADEIVVPRTPATRVPAGQSRREAVYDAALTLFSELGYQQTTINDIGRYLNMRGPSLYNHIKSKHELLAGILTGFLELGLAEQQRVLGESDDPVRQLRGMVDVHVQINAADPRQSDVGNSELKSLDEPHLSRVLAIRAEYEQNLLGVIKRGVVDGHFVVDEPRLACYAILAMGIHVSFWFRADGSMTPELVSRTYQDFALRILRWEPPAGEG